MREVLSQNDDLFLIGVPGERMGVLYNRDNNTAMEIPIQTALRRGYWDDPTDPIDAEEVLANITISPWRHGEVRDENKR